MERNRPYVSPIDRTTRSPASPTPTPAPTPVPAPRPPALDRPDTPMTGQGKLVFQITTAGGAIPLEGAVITLRESRSPVDAGGDVLAVLLSGRDGKTEAVSLPAPARGYSLEPTRDGAPVPYALYNADVTMDGFYTQSYIRIPVLDGITSIQRASLIPLPENGFEGGTRPDGENFIEGESPNL